MRRLLYILPVVALVLLSALFALLLSSPRDPNKIPSPLVNRPAPAFELPALMDGGTVGSDDLKGTITVLNVFASWCIPCRVEHPALMRIMRENKNVRLIGLNYKDKPEAAKAFLAELGNPYQRIAVDRTGRVAIDFGVYGVPETFLIDARGHIRFKHVGPIHPGDYADKIIPAIRRLMNEGGGK
jgi:cytochrome c biogenesis protein CcmG/thiol:disulfide interchange protein DsbE